MTAARAFQSKITLPESELSESFVRASGPGGQNVNKVATAVQLRFDVANSMTLPEPAKRRLRILAGRLMTKDGVLVIDARRYRTREQNRADARARLGDLLARAMTAPKKRKQTKTPLSAKRKRLELKKKRGLLKSMRSRPET